MLHFIYHNTISHVGSHMEPVVQLLPFLLVEGGLTLAYRFSFCFKLRLPLTDFELTGCIFMKLLSKITKIGEEKETLTEKMNKSSDERHT